jgi:hypothetical protein
MFAIITQRFCSLLQGSTPAGLTSFYSLDRPRAVTVNAFYDDYAVFLCHFGWKHTAFAALEWW